LSQSKRCREILGELTARPDTEHRPLGPLPMAALIEAAAAPYRRREIDFRVETAGELPPIPESPELSHGPGTLLQNAFELAHGQVRVRLSADGDLIRAVIADDGPGFDPDLLGQLGEPYVSRGGAGRERQGEHMGLGVFIALTLLERTGASLRFGNRPEGGS